MDLSQERSGRFTGLLKPRGKAMVGCQAFDHKGLAKGSPFGEKRHNKTRTYSAESS